MHSRRVVLLSLVLGCTPESVVDDEPSVTDPLFEDEEVDPPGTPPDPVLPAINTLDFRQTTAALALDGDCDTVDIAPDGRSLSFHGTFDFHGSLTKFTIRRHPTQFDYLNNSLMFFQIQVGKYYQEK